MHPSLLALLLANAVPLAGTLAFGWSVYETFALYWSESVVIGAYTILRLLLLQVPGKQPQVAGRLVFAAFFCAHFGLFLLAHAVFVQALVGPEGLHSGIELRAPIRLLETALQHESGLGLWALVVSHGVSFVVNFLARERSQIDFGRQLFAPYQRIFAMHLVLIAGGFLVFFAGSNALLLGLLVIAKTAADASAHRREHRLAAVTPSPGLPRAGT
ncbi:MAG: hypothetical protein FJ265_13060 [Planctomycetes bacterium]|nr:hypothetical protein [Planctomycetota bacterium]